jgi:hypothetical protein
MSGAIWDNLGAFFAACFVLLIVRVINRREQLSKRKVLVAVGTVAAATVLYASSFGPACWLVDGHLLPREATRRAYLPLTIMVARSPERLQQFFLQYSESRLAPLPRNVEPTGHKWILESY